MKVKDGIEELSGLLKAKGSNGRDKMVTIYIRGINDLTIKKEEALLMEVGNKGGKREDFQIGDPSGELSQAADYTSLMNT